LLPARDGASLIARTGYTGEDGFEIYFAPATFREVCPIFWKQVTVHGLLPAAWERETRWRLEASMCLYGHEIDDTTTPWEAA